MHGNSHSSKTVLATTNASPRLNNASVMLGKQQKWGQDTYEKLLEASVNHSLLGSYLTSSSSKYLLHMYQVQGAREVRAPLWLFMKR